jgi:hypothetical protein
MEVGLVKKDDSPRKWVYYRLTWKGRNLLHPERVRVMVSLGIMLTVIVVGALIIAMSTDFTTTAPPDDPVVPMAQTTVDVFWDESEQANVYDIHLQASTALTIAQVEDLVMYIEPHAHSISYDTPVELDWAWESDVIHLYDFEEQLKGHEGEFLYVEGTLLDDKAIEHPFHLYRYLVPTGWEIDLRISPLGIEINTSKLSDGLVSIAFSVENAGNLDANDTKVEVFSVHPRFMGVGFPSYGSPYLLELFNTTLNVATNGSELIIFDIPVSQLYRRGVVVVVDPDNAMPEMPTENNMATEVIPTEILDYNTDSTSTDEAPASTNLGFVAVMVAAFIFVVLVVVALLVLRND